VDLTEREREVLERAVDGATNRQIAETLQLSVKDVKESLDAVCGKLRGG
jgi:DNA-binding NarL/FixJ family response regulator